MANVSSQMDSMLPAVDDDRTPSKPRDTFNPLAFAKNSWESAKENFRDAGVTEVDLDDPALYNGYIRAVDYLKDTGLAGLDLVDAAAKVVIGTAGELITDSDASQKRFQRDIYSMPEAFAGAAGARSVSELDDAIEAAGTGVKAIASNANTGAQTIKAFFNKKNDNLFDDDGYNPVIMGDEDDYNPITDSKPSVVTDDDVAQEIRQMELDKKNYDFLDEMAIQQAYDAGVLNPEEWVDQTKALFKKQIKNMNTGGVEYDQKNLFIKAAESIGAENLVDLVKNKPTDPKGKAKWNLSVSSYADQANLTGNQLLSALASVQDSTGVSKKGLTERPLPIAVESGEVYPTKPFQEQYPVRTAEQRALDEKASKLGFKDTVYHTTRAQSQESYPFGEEFTEFKLPDQLAGKSPFTAAALHDLLGVHVGTARAAAERSEGYGGTGKFTMELRAKLDKPAEIEDLSEILGLEKDYRPFDNEFIPSEADLRTAINRESENLFGLKAFYTSDEELKAVKSLRQKLAKKGYTHIPYVNDVEDKESISYIMLTDRPKDSPAVLRDFRAKFDPEQRANPDLRMNEGGVVSMDQGGIIPEPTPLASDLARAKSKKRLEAADRLGYFIPPEIKDAGRRAFGLAEALDPAQGILRGMSATGRAFDQNLPASSRRQAAIEASLETLAPLGLVFLGKLAKDPAQKVLMDVLTPTGAPSSTADDVTFDPGRRKFLKQSLAAGTTAAVAPDILSDIIPKTTKAATKVASGIDAAVAKLVKMRKDSSLLIRAGLDIETDLRIKTGTPLPPKDNTLLLDPEYSDALKKEDEIRKKFVEDGSQKTVDDLYAEADKLGNEADRFAENILKTVGENPEALSSLDNQTVEDLIGSFNVDMLAPGSDMDSFPKAYEDVVKEAIRRGMHEDWEKYPMTELASEYILEDLSGAYNKGGLSMNQQMELFARGGLNDDGMDVDPVSGNEVPAGSLAEEVRDDIPAQLSEGEYVVPADVVRYYGVKFFEDLRTEAKQGLTDMEANGRIGGEPVMQDDDDLDIDLDDDDDDIYLGMDDMDIAAAQEMAVTGVANGGLMDKLAMAVRNDEVVAKGFASGGLVGEYAVGGMTESIYNDATQVDSLVNSVMAAARRNPSIYSELSSRGIEVNRTNPQMMAQQMNQANPPRMGFEEGGFVNPFPGSTVGGSYLTTMPNFSGTTQPQTTTTAATPSVEFCNNLNMDYDPETKTCVPRATTPTTTVRIDNDDDGPTTPTPTGDGTGGFGNWAETVDWSDPEGWVDENIKDIANKNQNKIGLGLALAAPGLGLVAGAGMAGQDLVNISKMKAMQLTYQSAGMDKQAKLMDGIISEYIAKQPEIVDDLEGWVASGTQRHKAIMKDLGFDDPDNVTPAEVRAALLSKSAENVSNKPPATDGESGGGSDRGTSPRPVLRPSSDDDDDDGPTITPPSGPSTTVNTTPPAASGPTASTGGGMTGSDTRPNDPRGEGQYGGQSTSSPISSTSGLSQAEIQANRDEGARLGYAKGGLMKKPKKKK